MWKTKELIGSLTRKQRKWKKVVEEEEEEEKKGMPT